MVNLALQKAKMVKKLQKLTLQDETGKILLYKSESGKIKHLTL